MKILDKLKNKLEGSPEPWLEGLPRPYDQGRIIPLVKFLHGPELVTRQEEAREQRRKWAFRYLTGKDEDE